MELFALGIFSQATAVDQFLIAIAKTKDTNHSLIKICNEFRLFMTKKRL